MEELRTNEEVKKKKTKTIGDVKPNCSAENICADSLGLETIETIDRHTTLSTIAAPLAPHPCDCVCTFCFGNHTGTRINFNNFKISFVTISAPFAVVLKTPPLPWIKKRREWLKPRTERTPFGRVTEWHEIKYQNYANLSTSIA